MKILLKFFSQKLHNMVNFFCWEGLKNKIFVSELEVGWIFTDFSNSFYFLIKKNVFLWFIFNFFIILIFFNLFPCLKDLFLFVSKHFENFRIYHIFSTCVFDIITTTELDSRYIEFDLNAEGSLSYGWGVWTKYSPLFGAPEYLEKDS